MNGGTNLIDISILTVTGAFDASSSWLSESSRSSPLSFTRRSVFVSIARHTNHYEMFNRNCKSLSANSAIYSSLFNLFTLLIISWLKSLSPSARINSLRNLTCTVLLKQCNLCYLSTSQNVICTRWALEWKRTFIHSVTVTIPTFQCVCLCVFYTSGNFTHFNSFQPLTCFEILN